MTENGYPPPTKGKPRRSPKGRGEPQHYLYRLSFRLLGTAPSDSETKPSAGATLDPIDQGRWHYVEDRMVRVAVPKWADPRGFTEYPSSVFLLGSLEMIRDPKCPQERKNLILIQVRSYLTGERGPLPKPFSPTMRRRVLKRVRERAEASGEPPKRVFLEALDRAFALAEPSSNEECSVEESILRQVMRNVTEDFLGSEEDWRQLYDPNRRGPKVVAFDDRAGISDPRVDREEANDLEQRRAEDKFLLGLIQSELPELPPRQRELLEAIINAGGDTKAARAQLRERGWSASFIGKTLHQMRKGLRSRRDSELG